jgi:hypothetical protein
MTEVIGDVGAACFSTREHSHPGPDQSCPFGERACAVTSRSSKLPGRLDERRTAECERRVVERRDSCG